MDDLKEKHFYEYCTEALIILGNCFQEHFAQKNYCSSELLVNQCSAHTENAPKDGVRVAREEDRGERGAHAERRGGHAEYAHECVHEEQEGHGEHELVVACKRHSSS